MSTTRSHGRSENGRAPLRARVALVSAAVVVVSLGGTGVASASLVSQPQVAAGSLCNGVRPSQVAEVMGYPVPAPTVSSSSDSSLGLVGTFTLCLYAHPTSPASMQQEVGLSYITLSHVPAKATALAFIKRALKKAQQSKDSTWTYTLDNHFGMTNLYATATSTGGVFSFTVTVDVAWRGDKVAEAFVFSRLPKSKIYALEKLAIDNFGL